MKAGYDVRLASGVTCAGADEPIIARYVRSLGLSGLSTDDASWPVHDPEPT